LVLRGVMNINGPFFDRYRIEPMRDATDEQQRRGDSRSIYKGRQWRPKQERCLFLSPKSMRSIAQTEVPLDPKALAKAKQMLESMTTLEEKVAQLCLCQTEALYDTDTQHRIESLVLGWQIGGLVFQEGELRRQGYLVDHYQELSKTPLLIGNDFLHGLSFYFSQEDIALSRQEDRFNELGKAITGLNRSLHVHFQFDQERQLDTFTNQDICAQAFRKGVREARGLVARSIPEPKYLLHAHAKRFSDTFSPIKTLHVLDLVHEVFNEAQLLEALRKGYHMFLEKEDNIERVMTLLHAALIKGKLSERELDKYVLRLLYLKALVTQVI